MNELIERYYNQELTPEEKKRFERDILQDPQLAREIAFYLQTRQVLREELLEKRHAEWQAIPQPTTIHRTIKPWYYSAAAMLLLTIGLGWYFLSQPTALDTRQMAAAYIEKNLYNLPKQMDGQKDSLQATIDYYHKGQFIDAAAWANSMLARNPTNAEVLKVAGVVALRTKNYDKALDYFHRLGEQPDLFENPGKFYEAITYLLRNEPLDKIKADSLLHVVIVNNLDGKEEAEKWVDEK